MDGSGGGGGVVVKIMVIVLLSSSHYDLFCTSFVLPFTPMTPRKGLSSPLGRPPPPPPPGRRHHHSAPAQPCLNVRALEGRLGLLVGGRGMEGVFPVQKVV